MAFLIFVAIFWIAPIVVGHSIGVGKNRAGWAWGLLLGWIGVIVVACLGTAEEKTAHQSFRLSTGADAGAGASVASIGLPPNLPAAGWYADPDDAGRVRYWDGTDWTHYVDAADADAPPRLRVSAESAYPANHAPLKTEASSSGHELNTDASSRGGSLSLGNTRIAVVALVIVLILIGVVAAIASVGGAYKTATATHYETIHVIAPPGKCWSGAMGDSTKDGCGSQDVSISQSGPIGGGNAQKLTPGSWQLSLSLDMDGSTVDTASTTAEYGIAQVVGSF
jgi:hypothetical protein